MECHDCGGAITDKSVVCVRCGCTLDHKKLKVPYQEKIIKVDTSKELTTAQLNRYEIMAPDRILSEAYRYHYKSPSKEICKAKQLYQLILEKYPDSVEANKSLDEINQLKNWFKVDTRAAKTMANTTSTVNQTNSIKSSKNYSQEPNWVPETPNVASTSKQNRSDNSDAFSIGTLIYFVTVVYYWFVFWNQDYPVVSFTSIIVFPFYSIKAAFWPIIRLFQ